MSTKINWWTVAATSTLLCASAAHADLLGIDYELVGVNYITGPNAPAGDHYTVDVFAIIDSGDRLDAVAGDENVDKIVSALPTGSFYQSPFGANTSAGINPALFGSFPSVQYDSFVTIGLLDQDDNAMSDQGIDFSQFQSGGDIFADNGAWYVTPVDPQGVGQAFTAQDCSQQTAVRVARLTVNGLDTTIHLEALFQGKDSAGATWTGNGGVDISYAPITDCNENGVADECDIANGDSDDTNENGVPDECDNFDCNDNGQDDADDIADGTSSDCNGNGVPDECDVADGTSSDCNGNGVPDECESDCNGNGIPDECDVDGGSSEDCDGDGTPDECEPDSDGDGIIDDCEVPPNYVNLDNGGVYEFFADAIVDADDGDRIEGLASAVNSETEMNFNETCVNFSVADEVDTNAEVFLASCGTMEVGTNAFFNNNVYSGVGGTYRIEAAGNLEFFDMLIVRSGATVETACINGTDVNGFTLRPNSMLTASQAIIMDSGTATMFEGSMIESLLTNNGGMFNAQGTILSAVINLGQMT